MGRVKILKKEVYEKIAAGEVIDRPVSVVKELIENALDAGAESIEIELSDGGKSAISIRDGGHGFHPEDVEIAFQRHSTSKFNILSDFDRLKTLGFRGEALPSISVVANVEIKTSDNDNGIGIHLRIEENQIKWKKEIAFSKGTTIEVKNLFYNFPVRKKFLKSERTELKQISSYVEQIALVKYNTSFTLKNNQRIICHYDRVNQLADRIYQIFGKDFFDSLTEVQMQVAPYKVKGFISKLNTGISVKKHQYFFVNGRPVREKTLISSFNNNFYTFLEKHKHPLGILIFEIPPQEIDVNIHPMKLEIKFQNSNDIYLFVKKTIAGTFHQASGGMQVGMVDKYSYQEQEPLPGHHIPHPETQIPLLGIPHTTEDDFVMIGQFKNSYLIVEKDDQLLIVDQHNAQERIIFEKLKSQYKSGKVASITPLFPIIIDLTPSEKLLFNREKNALLEAIGFQIEPLSGNSFDVKQFPQILEERKVKDAIITILHLSTKEANLEDKVLAEMACKSAIKINHPLHPEKMRTIIRSLFLTSNPNFCPHQRPIIIKFSLEEIEKMIKRK